MVSLREKEIIKILKEFRERTNILCSTLFTEDGFIIAVDQTHNTADEDYHQSIGAISASIVSLAEEGTQIIKENNKLKQIRIQAGDQLDNEGFIILLESITDEIRLSIICPIFLNLGVVLFELNQTIQKLSNYFTSQERFDALGSISTLL